ncbi:pentatricopeptide repeat-containing protein 1, mitochondrial [Eucyclogobius newberryi]|uniref:pentatricopeptide repeat-containing protein 1, mitochondrial n=1 Tax=Eucyclogobius newberryi TaxID=166745 RepID=UPI003B5AB46D
MFYSVARCVRSGSAQSARVALGVRTLHGAVKRSGPGTRAGAQAPDLHLLRPLPRLLLSGAGPARALSIPAAGPPVRAAAHQQTVPEEEEEEGGFGALSGPLSARRSYRKSSPYLEESRYPEDEEDEGAQRVRRRRRVNTPYWYFQQCKKLIKENKLQEALDLFSRDMLQGERLQPEEFNYSVLIGGCGRAGQLKNAFRLYNDMKKRGLEPLDAIFTALFNACAECPSKRAGLHQALKLEQELRRKNQLLATPTYHALLKVHAVTNHLQACLHTLREMLENGHVATQETFHYLLMSCVKDKEVGFRLALQIWRQMLISGIRPDSKNYTLLLRTARDCGIGDPAQAAAVLLGPVEAPKRRDGPKKRIPPPGVKPTDVDVLERLLLSEPETLPIEGDGALVPISAHQINSLPANIEENPNGPNLLDVFEGKNSGVVSLCAGEKVSDRLALLGGAVGFLQSMEGRGLRPDLKTLTLLADTAEPGRPALALLLRTAKQHQVKLDVAFFNSVIRRAARAGDMDTAQAVLSVMRQRHVSVDVQTFGCLALGCDQEKDALQLLSNMEKLRLRPNVHIFSALIGRAGRRLDYIYLKKLLMLMKEKEVWPNEVIIRQLEFASQYPPNYDQFKRRNNYLVQIDGFRGYYQHWLRSVPAQTEQTEQEQTARQQEEQKQQEEQGAEGPSDAQRNQSAASRRYNSKKGKSSSSAAQSAL